MITAQEAAQELEDLNNLVKSSGWQRFCRQVLDEGGKAVDAEMARALDETNDQVAAGRMRQAIAGRRAVEKAVQWPAIRLKQLTVTPEHDTGLPASRRGAL